jgi:glycosyltransferase involved in cell wall biosynthesis
MSKPRLLVITLAKTRSGVPMLTLHLLRHLLKQDQFEISAVLATEGEMVADFRALIPVEVYDRGEPQTSAPVRWWRRQPAVARRREANRVARCRSVVGQWPPDLVFCNSAGAAGILDALGPYSCPVVVGVHEMEFVLRIINWIPGGATAAMTRHATHYAAGSDAVRQHLIGKLSIPVDRVSVVHAFIPTAEFETSPVGASKRTANGIPEGAIVVGAIGTVEWRKGADLLVPLAREIFRRPSARPVHLLWVGGGTADEVANLRLDIAAAGLADRVHLAGSTSRTADWYPAFTIFALLSREDPFPLVALEAAASGVPIICFAGGGGMPEFVENDCGRVVPYLDLGAFADAVVELGNDAGLLSQLGENAAKKVRTRHDVSVAAPLLVQVLERAAEKKFGRRSGTDGHR